MDIEKLFENENFYDEFCNVLENVKPMLSNLLVMEYQNYLSEILKRNVTESEVRDTLSSAFEDYRFNDIFK